MFCVKPQGHSRAEYFVGFQNLHGMQIELEFLRYEVINLFSAALCIGVQLWTGQTLFHPIVTCVSCKVYQLNLH